MASKTGNLKRGEPQIIEKELKGAKERNEGERGDLMSCVELLPESKFYKGWVVEVSKVKVK